MNVTEALNKTYLAREQKLMEDKAYLNKSQPLLQVYTHILAMAEKGYGSTAFTIITDIRDKDHPVNIHNVGQIEAQLIAQGYKVKHSAYMDEVLTEDYLEVQWEIQKSFWQKLFGR